MYKIVVISGFILSAICVVLFTIAMINLIGIEMFIIITSFIGVWSYLYRLINKI